MTVLGSFNGNQVTALTNKKGATVGTRIVFGGECPAGQVRKALKAKNPKLTGKELTLKVNEVITGKNTLAWAEVQVGIEGLRSAGYTPDYVDARKSGATVRFAKPVEAKDAAPRKLTIDVATVATMTKEEREAAILLLSAAE